MKKKGLVKKKRTGGRRKRGKEKRTTEENKWKGKVEERKKQVEFKK